MLDKWDLERKINMKALKDHKFKTKLLSSPKEAIRDFFKHEGISFAPLEHVGVHIKEENKNEWNFSLISLATVEQHGQLSAGDLEKLAGGTCGSGSIPN